MRTIAVVIAVLLAGCSGDSDSPATAATSPPAAAVDGYEPVYEDAACADGVPDDPRVRCGVLTVPEDRGDLAGGIVRLPVAVVASKAGTQQADPVVYLEGGPGFSGLDRVAYFLEHDVAPGRDVITFDQRGTGGADPSLECPEIDARTVLPGTADGSAVEASARAAASACRRRLSDRGVDLGAYDTVTNAEDVADLRVAMGVEEWNLFGFSYGTLLALEVVRSHPEGVRALVIDSAAPPHRWAPLDPVSFVERFERVLALLERRCAEDPGCAAAFPAPRAEFDRMVQRYEDEPFHGAITHPTSGEPLDIVVTGQDIVSGAFQAFYDTALIPLLPSITRQLLEGDTSVIPLLAQESVDQQVRLAEAMAGAVECADTAATVDTDQEQRVAQLVAERPLWERFIREGVAMCEVWDVPPVPEEFRLPVTSDTPALVLAGEFDPVTPPAWGRAAADHLGDAAYVELPGVGHGAVFAHGCPRAIFRAFVDDPDAPLDTACVTEMGPPDWALPS